MCNHMTRRSEKKMRKHRTCWARGGRWASPHLSLAKRVHQGEEVEVIDKIKGVPTLRGHTGNEAGVLRLKKRGKKKKR